MATRKVYANLDLTKNQLLNYVEHNLASAPGSALAGQRYYDTAINQSGYYNGSVWVYPTATATPNAYGVISTGGSNASGTANSSGADTFKLRTANSAIVIAITDNDGTYGDNALFTFTPGNVRLDQFAIPTANLNVNSNKLTNVTDPTSAQDAATKNYVDAAIQGVQWKPEARVATTVALAANTYANGASGFGATLTANGNGAIAAVDGITLIANDRVLVKNEATGANNGLYTLTAVGTGSVPYVLTRVTDMDVSTEFQGGAVFVTSGTTNGSQAFVCTNTAAPTVGTTAITFAQITGVADITAGTGIVKAGNTMSIDTAWAGQTAITTLGTITTGTWTGTSIAVLNGGTGATTSSTARTNLGAVGKYSATIGDGSSTAIAITQATHGLASDRTNLAIISDATTGDQVDCQVTYGGTGTVTFTFNTAPTTNQFRVTIIG